MYSIIRKQSHKKTSIQAVHNHNMRIVIEENINTKKSHLNEILVGTENTRQDIMGYIKSNDIKVRNKDTIVFNEFIMTASPEFFFNNEDGSKKNRSDYDKNLNEWVKTQIEYLEKGNYGKCVNAVLHLDESTPHIHAIILPIADNKLNNKSFWRGKNSYSRLIDDYSQANKKHGLRRGEAVSETLVKHTTLKDYRDLIRQDQAEEKMFYNEVAEKILNVPVNRSFIGLEKKYSADEVKDLATSAFKKLNRQRRRSRFKVKKAEERSEAATSQFYKQRNKASEMELRKTELSNEFKDYKSSTSEVIEQNHALKHDLSDFELMRRVLPVELQALVKRARDIDAGGSGTAEPPKPDADLKITSSPKPKP